MYKKKDCSYRSRSIDCGCKGCEMDQSPESQTLNFLSLRWRLNLGLISYVCKYEERQKRLILADTFRPQKHCPFTDILLCEILTLCTYVCSALKYVDLMCKSPSVFLFFPVELGQEPLNNQWKISYSLETFV